MAGVIGIGGVFVKFKDPALMKQWYANVLGLTTNDYGVLFEFGGENTSKGYLQLGTFEESTEYFGSPKQQTMINFRVDDLVAFKKQLEEHKVTIINEIDEYSYGKFLHIEDPEGNRLELWEPVDAEFEANEKSVMPMR